VAVREVLHNKMRYVTKLYTLQLKEKNSQLMLSQDRRSHRQGSVPRHTSMEAYKRI